MTAYSDISKPRLTAAERKAIARAASLARWANTTPEQRRQATAGARAAAEARFDAAPNPDAARRAHVAAMTAASIRKRHRTGT